jgi:TolB-like protein
MAMILILIIVPMAPQVEAASPQMGAVPLSQAISNLAERLAKGIPENRPMTVAVTDFPDSISNQTCGLGRFVAERLTTLLSQHPQCQLIERRRLDMVLNELKFSMSELVDPAKAKKLGQMLGVQGLVLGSVTDLGGTADVDARIIDIQTNVSLPGASASIVQDEVVKKLISKCAPEGSNLAPEVGGTVPANPRQSYPEATEGDITVAVPSCQMRGTTVTCALVITNNGQDVDFKLYNEHWSPSSRFFDQSGNEYRATLVRLGNQESRRGGGEWGVSNTLVKGVPTSAALVFEKVSPDVTSITALIVGFNEPRGGSRTATLRNLALTKQ